MSPDAIGGRRAAAFLIDEAGASAGEYALLLTVLGGCALIILHILGARMSSIFSRLADALG